MDVVVEKGEVTMDSSTVTTYSSNVMADAAIQMWKEIPIRQSLPRLSNTKIRN